MKKETKVETIGYWNVPFKKHNDNDIDLSCLVGKKIVAVGRVDLSGLPRYMQNEADLAIDYQDGKITKRIVVGANDCGTWIEWAGQKGVASPVDEIKTSLKIVWDDLPELKIVHKPHLYKYSFVDPKGKEVFSLDISQLKVLPKNIRDHFTSGKPKNVEKIISAISEWMYF